jgi:hypothetical protein
VLEQWHRFGSRTYGGRNAAAQIKADAKNAQTAAVQDSQRMIDGASAADRAAAEYAAYRVRLAAGKQ